MFHVASASTYKTEPSQYASSDTLRRRVQRLGGDLSEPATLRVALEDRAFRGEVILFAFNFCSISDALALMATLRRASFEHFLPFTDGRETCQAMQHLAAVGGGLQHGAAAALQAPPPCFWSSWPGNHTGWHHWGTRPDCVTADLNGQRACVLEQLWLSRYSLQPPACAACSPQPPASSPPPLPQPQPQAHPISRL